MAAMHMDGTAQVLAKGIVASKGISGNVTGAAGACLPPGSSPAPIGSRG